MFKLPATKKNKILYNVIKNIFKDIFEGLDFVFIEEKQVCFLAGEYLKKVISKRRYSSRLVSKALTTTYQRKPKRGLSQWGTVERTAKVNYEK